MGAPTPIRRIFSQRQVLKPEDSLQGESVHRRAHHRSKVEPPPFSSAWEEFLARKGGDSFIATARVAATIERQEPGVKLGRKLSRAGTELSKVLQGRWDEPEGPDCTDAFLEFEEAAAADERRIAVGCVADLLQCFFGKRKMWADRADEDTRKRYFEGWLNVRKSDFSTFEPDLEPKDSDSDEFGSTSTSTVWRVDIDVPENQIAIL